MKIVDIKHHAIAISRYDDPSLPSGGLTTSLVALVTDVVRDGKPVVGYGFASFGRYAQGGLIEERFAPRLLNAPTASLSSPEGGNLDPVRAWGVMMAGEKPGGHGERCVAVGTLDMAVWDAAAKIAGRPLHRLLARRGSINRTEVAVYAGGGYPYPENGSERLADEVRRMRDLGYDRVKIKIGAAPLAQDMRRVDAVAKLLPGADHLAVDAMNAFDGAACLEAAAALAPLGLWWFEDICDPLDLETLALVANTYAPPIAAGEALFSLAEAKLLHRFGGLRPNRDILVFDPVHCYGLTHYMKIVEALEAAGWPRRAFWPHGGHLFSLQVAAGLGLGGCEVNPYCFQPLGGLPDQSVVSEGRVALPEAPGIGLESRNAVVDLLRRHLGA